LGIRLVQRTTHDVQLTEAGAALKKRCGDMLLHVDEAIDHVSNMGAHPRGPLRISVATAAPASRKRL
jgi:DNA-binding transcriptional LysR family regulator